jgi:flagellar protein FliO/FliZ
MLLALQKELKKYGKRLFFKIKTLVTLMVTGVFFTPPIFGITPTASKNPPLPALVDGSSVLHMLLGLMVVIALIFLCAFFVRRLNGLTITNRQMMRIVAALPLGTREKIVLIEVGKQQLLLGLAPGSITTLHVLTEPVELTSNTMPANDFVRKLQSILQKEST